MPTLPNPFLCALEAAMPAHSAAAPDLTDPPVAAADQFPRGFDGCVFEEILGFRPILPMAEF